MSTSSHHEQELQGIRFADESPEALIFTLTHDQSAPNDVTVSFTLGYDEPCIFEMDLTKLRRSLLPTDCVFHTIARYDNGATRFECIEPTTEGDFIAGFEAGLMFDFQVNGAEHQVWLPLKGLNEFVNAVPGVSAQAHDCAIELSVGDLEFAEFRPQPLQYWDMPEAVI